MEQDVQNDQLEPKVHNPAASHIPRHALRPHEDKDGNGWREKHDNALYDEANRASPDELQVARENAQKERVRKGEEEPRKENIVEDDVRGRDGFEHNNSNNAAHLKASA
jgi:hypothetical protein